MLLENANPSEHSLATAATSFPPSNWKHILKLLGLIIVADGRVLKEEVDTYLDVVTELRAVIDPTIYLTRHMARDWLMLNKQELTDIIDSLAYDTALCEILAPIKSMPHKLDVISGMVKIAISDGDYCAIERGLVKKTILYWNVRNDAHSALEHENTQKHIANA